MPRRALLSEARSNSCHRGAAQGELQKPSRLRARGAVPPPRGRVLSSAGCSEICIQRMQSTGPRESRKDPTLGGAAHAAGSAAAPPAQAPPPPPQPPPASCDPRARSQQPGRGCPTGRDGGSEGALLPAPRLPCRALPWPSRSFGFTPSLAASSPARIRAHSRGGSNSCCSNNDP